MKKFVIKISLAFVIIAFAIDYLRFTIDYFFRVNLR